MNLIYNAATIPSALMAAALHEQDFLCRIFGKCLAGDLLDGEVGTAIGQGIPNVLKLFTYVRYNAELSRQGLDALGLDHINPVHVQQMDSVDHIGEMQEVGDVLAQPKSKGRTLRRVSCGELACLFKISTHMRWRGAFRICYIEAPIEELELVAPILPPLEKRLCARQFSGSFVPVWHPIAGWVV